MVENLPEACKLALQKIYGSDLHNYIISVHGVGKKGEGYMNDMVFLTLNNGGEDIQLVVKMLPNVKGAPNMIKSLNCLYRTEIEFYENIWPKLSNFQTEYIAKDGFNKIPKYYGSLNVEEHMVLVLENLKAANFTLRDKHHLYDKTLVEYLFREYAKFHAISFAFKEIQKTEFVRISASLSKSWNNVRDAPLMVIVLPSLLNIVTSHLPEGDVKEKMSRFSSRISDEFDDVTKYKGDSCILTHGDSWINNFLFKVENSGGLLDVRFIDFQMIQMGTPVYDLSYFFYSGATKDLLDELDHYLQIYHIALSDRLREYGCDPNKIYSFEKFKEEWKQYSKFGFIVSILSWKGKLTENPIDLNDEDQLKNNSSVDRKCDEIMYARITGDLVHHVIERGFICNDY